MKPLFNITTEIFDKIITESLNTSSSKWLLSLTDYDCPTCGKKTIFINGCGTCMDKEEQESL